MLELFGEILRLLGTFGLSAIVPELHIAFGVQSTLLE